MGVPLMLPGSAPRRRYGIRSGRFDHRYIGTPVGEATATSTSLIRLTLPAGKRLMDNTT
jgi:hypothetical protein